MSEDKKWIEIGKSLGLEVKRDRGILAPSLDMNVVIIKLMFSAYNINIILIKIKKTR